MRPKYQYGLVSILFLLVFIIAACGSNPAGSNTGNKNVAKPAASPDKQVLRQSVEGGDFDTIDPQLTYGNGDPINLLWTGMVQLNPDGTAYDQLAASHTVSDDGKTYTFTLRDGIKFSDGTPITADDVAYSINRAVDPATESGVASYLSLLVDFDKANTGAIKTLIGDSIIVKDQKTVVLKITKSAPYFLGSLAYPTSYVVNKKLIEKYGKKWTDHVQEGGSSGPMTVESYNHSSGMVLVPNPNYYGQKSKILKFVYTFGGDRDSNWKAYLAGQFDIGSVPPSQHAIAEKRPDFYYTPTLAIRFIEMNYLAKPFDNDKIRQAFILALNRKLVVQKIIGKYVFPTNHIVPKGQPGYDEKVTGPAGIANLEGDQAKAKELFQAGLQEAGYGTVDKLPPITLNYTLNYKAGADTLTAFAQQWKEVLGVDVKLVGLQNQDVNKKLSEMIGSKDIQMFYTIWQADYPDPQDWLSVFYGKGSDHNYVNYGVTADQKAVQDSLAAADTEMDNAKRMAAYNAAEEKIINDGGYLATYQTSFVLAVNPKLTNWKLGPLGFNPTNDWANIYFTT